MHNITVIAVGKIKEKFYTAAVEEYAKRLSAYCKFSVVEVKDEKTPDNPTEVEKAAVLAREGQRIAEKIPKGAKVIALCVEGKEMTSEGFASLLEKSALDGDSKLVFIIGGSMGLVQEIKDMASVKLSFSQMTFPHMLMRVVLAEQIYRAFTIIEGKTYHK